MVSGVLEQGSGLMLVAVLIGLKCGDHVKGFVFTPDCGNCTGRRCVPT